jgi:thymidylate kinase
MLIEFFGLPGAGKSTLSRLVADHLLSRRLVVDEITYDLAHRNSRRKALLNKLAHVVRFAAARPRRTLSDLVRIVATRQATLVDLGKSFFNWIFISSLATRKRSPVKIIFLDQGIAQALWSIGFAARRENWLELLLAASHGTTPRPDLIVFVRAELQVIGNRLAAREGHASRMDAFQRDHEVLRRSEAHADAIIDRLRSGGVSVIEVENNDSMQLVSSARLVADAIMTALSEHRGTSGAGLQQDTPFATHEASRTDRALTDSRAILRQYLLSFASES